MKTLAKLCVAILPFVVALVAAPSANAQANAPVVTPSGKFCVYYAPTQSMACVDEPSELAWARAAAFGISLASAQQGAAPEGSYALGVFYDDPGYHPQDGTITWFDDHDCTPSLSNIDSGWSDTTTWRDRISSFKGLSSCFIRPWGSTNYTGATLPGFVSQEPTLGALNNHVWSVQFS